MTTMVKRALDRMMHPRPINLPTNVALHPPMPNPHPMWAEDSPLAGIPVSELHTLKGMIARQADTIGQLQARVAELERERDGLLDLIL